jgi:hypothetical protein
MRARRCRCCGGSGRSAGRRVFQAGDEAQDAGLVAELEVVLEADEVVAVGAQVLLAELDDGVGPAAGLGIGEADGLHGAEAEGVAAAAGGLFDGQTALRISIGRQFEVVEGAAPRALRGRLGGGEGVEEAVVLLAVKGQLM